MNRDNIRILNIETTTKNCSVSIFQDNTLISIREHAGEQYTHAEQLNVFIEKVMNDAGVQFTDLSAVAVSKGPGSYTGLRIGVSSAKGICYACDIPLIATDTLHHLALSVSADQGYIISVSDARRMEVYQSVFDYQHQKITPAEAVIVTPDTYAGYAGKPVVFIGNGVEKIQDVIRLPQVRFIEKKPLRPGDGIPVL